MTFTPTNISVASKGTVFDGKMKFINVDSTEPAMTENKNPSSLSCDTGAGKCSFRAALQVADNLSDDDASIMVQINIPEGRYEISQRLTVHAKRLRLQGASLAGTILDGSKSTNGILELNQVTSLELNSLTFINGIYFSILDPYGGALLLIGGGDINLVDCQFLENSVPIGLKAGRNYFNGAVKSMVVDGDNAFFAGDFTAIDPTLTPAAVQLDSTTGLLAVGDCSVSRRIAGIVYAAASSETHIFLGGSIKSYDGKAVQNLLKIKLSDCSLDEGFSTAIGFDKAVNTLLLRGTSLYVGGQFTTYRATPVTALAKLNADDGTIDTGFSRATTVGTVTTIAYSSGSLYVGGIISSYDGNTVQALIKIEETTGNLDTTFTTASGFLGKFGVGKISKVVIFNDAIYVGGDDLGSYRGVTIDNIAKLNLSNGNLDSVFSQASGIGFPGRNRDMTTDGKSLFVAGEFWTYRGAQYAHLVKLDANSGAVDTAFTKGPIRANGAGLNRIFYYNNFIYIGGIENESYRGESVSNLFRVDSTTGDLDTIFSNNLSVNSEVSSIGIIPNGNILVGGHFTSVDGGRAMGIAKLNLTTGLFDTSFSGGGGFDRGVVQVLVSGDSVYALGEFTSYKGQPARHLAKLDKTTGVLDTAFSQSAGPNLVPVCFHLFGDSLYLGGNFTDYRGSAVARIIKVSTATGNLDTTFSKATNVNSFMSEVSSITDDGTAIYIGGRFVSYRGSPAKSIAKLDAINGNLDTNFTQATAFNDFSQVSDLVYSNGNIYASGSFLSYRGSAVTGLVKLDSTNGNLDTTFTQAAGLAGGSGSKRIMLSGDSLYVVHDALIYRGQSVRILIKIDSVSGNLDTRFDIGANPTALFISMAPWGNPNSPIISMAIWGQQILTGGSFNTFNSVYSPNFVLIDKSSGIAK